MKIKNPILKIIGFISIVYQFYIYYSTNTFLFIKKNGKDLYDYIFDFGYIIGINIWLILGIIFIVSSKYKFKST
jgi:hypothetical protein